MAMESNPDEWIQGVYDDQTAPSFGKQFHISPSSRYRRLGEDKRCWVGSRHAPTRFFLGSQASSWIYPSLPGENHTGLPVVSCGLEWSGMRECHSRHHGGLRPRGGKCRKGMLSITRLGMLSRERRQTHEKCHKEVGTRTSANGAGYVETPVDIMASNITDRR